MPSGTPLQSGVRLVSPELPHEFAHPPLIEVWLGVEYDDPVNFEPVEAMEWRRRLGPEWPPVWRTIGPVERHAPAVTHVEKQMQNVMGDRAIRFGPHGFSYGWLGYDGSIYPRYETIRDGFVATLDAVSDVLPGIGSPKRTTVSYLNRIPQGTVWTTVRDWSFFRLWQPSPLQKLGIVDHDVSGCWQYPLEGKRGTLRVEFSHESALMTPLEIESVWLRITSASEISDEDGSLFDGLDHGREMVVRSFNELVTSEAKDFWGVLLRK